jgi:hypothetical protein
MDLIIENFIDLSYVAALFLAAQAEKKFDLFGLIIKRGASDKVKVLFIGLIHSVVWIFFFMPETSTMKEHIKIILTSYLATVVLYDYFLKKFIKNFG